jgi:L-fuconolactonase
MRADSPVIDCQVHAYERNRPERPWAGFLHGPDEVTGDDMVAAMDAVGVDGALLVSPHSMYRFDPSYALEVHKKYPQRFGLIKPFDPRSERIADEVGEWAAKDGVVGARLMLTYQAYEADDPGIDLMLNAAGRAGIPLNVMCADGLALFSEIARSHPNTRLVIDHLGLAQPFEPPPTDEPFADLDLVLALAEVDNVAIKISGACTLSNQPFPYPDIWEPLGRIFDAFGLDRCMWGTDWTRAVNLLTYEQGVAAFRVTERLSASERSLLMGGSLAKIYNWSPGP